MLKKYINKQIRQTKTPSNLIHSFQLTALSFSLPNSSEDVHVKCTVLIIIALIYSDIVHKRNISVICTMSEYIVN